MKHYGIRNIDSMGADILKYWLAVRYSCNRNKTVHRQDISPTVFMEVDSHKHLGVFLSNICAWHNHIDHVMESTWGRIDIMRGLKFCLDRESLETLFYLHKTDMLGSCLSRSLLVVVIFSKIKANDEKSKVWSDVFQPFFPVQSSFRGGTRAHMVPASIAQGNN